MRNSATGVVYLKLNSAATVVTNHNSGWSKWKLHPQPMPEDSTTAANTSIRVYNGSISIFGDIVDNGDDYYICYYLSVDGERVAKSTSFAQDF